MNDVDPSLPEPESPHLRTDKLRLQVGKRAVRGAAILGFSRPLRVVVGLGITGVLARLLTPQEFGLVGMVAIVMRFIDNFKDIGLGQAMIQRDGITNAQLNSLFWINGGVGVGLAVVLGVCSPAVAWFFDEARLTWITCGLASGVALSGFGLQHRSLLRRQMRFGALTMIELSAFSLAGVAGIALALIGASYWALVGRVVAEALVMAVGYAFVSRWRPSAPAIVPGVGSLVRFGSRLTGFNLLNFFSRNADDLLVGKLFGPEALAAYQRAYDLMMMGSKQVVNPAGQIAMPALSRLASEPEKYSKAYFRIIDKVLLVTAPTAGMLLAVPDWIVQVVLGSQWEAAGPITRALGVAVLIQPLSGSIGWLLTSQDRTEDLPMLGVISGVVNLILFGVGAFWGPLGVATAYGLGQFVRSPIGLGYVTRTGPIRRRDMYLTLATFAGVGISGAVITYAARPLMETLPAPLAVCAAGVVCVLGCALTLTLIPRGRHALVDVLTTARQLLSKRRS